MQGRGVFDPLSHANPLYESGYSGGTAAQIVERFDPAFGAINGYYNEWEAAENGCSLSSEFRYGLQGVEGVAGTLGFAAGGAAAASAAETAASGGGGSFTQLFRITDEAETADIANSGAYRTLPMQEGKFFFPTAEQGTNLAEMFGSKADRVPVN